MKLLTGFQNVINSQVIKSLEKALATFYSRNVQSHFCVTNTGFGL